MKHAHLVYQANIKPVKPINNELTLARCRVMALGKNRNLSHFTKESVDNALPTLANIPIIGHVYADSDGKLRLGGHDCEIVSEDGEYRFKSTCVPWGCVPESHNAHYEEVEEIDGTKATYLVADVILWNRYEDIFKTFYSDDVYANQSMEISVEDYAKLEGDRNYTDITKFSFSALCLLNRGENEQDPDNVTPCFPSSDVQPYKFELDDNFYQLAEQFKAAMSLCFDKEPKEGGMNRMTNEEIAEILAEFSLTLDELPFEVDENITEEEFRSNLEALQSQKTGEAGAEGTGESASFSATYREKQTAIQNALDPVVERDENGKLVKEVTYWLMDFDDNMVYAEQYIWTADNNERHYVRAPYTFDDNSKTASINGDFEEVFMTLLTKEERDKVEEDRNSFEELKAYKAANEKALKESELDGVYAEFTDISGTEEYAELMKDKYAFDNSDALRKELYAIRGKNISVKFSHPGKKPGNKIPLGVTGDDDYQSAFFKKYSN